MPGVAARLFSTIAQEEINVLMISQSSSEYNICVLIEAAHADAGPAQHRARSSPSNAARA